MLQMAGWADLLTPLLSAPISQEWAVHFFFLLSGSGWIFQRLCINPFASLLLTLHPVQPSETRATLDLDAC